MGRRIILAAVAAMTVLSVETPARGETASTIDARRGSVSLAAASPKTDQPQPILPIGSFETIGDNVHLSSSLPAATSGHGWWKMISGPSGVMAKGTVDLQAEDVHGKWVTVSTGYKVVYSGGGSANWAVARKECTNLIQRVVWRTVIDVDLIGINDPPNKTTTSALPFYCGAGI